MARLQRLSLVVGMTLAVVLGSGGHTGEMIKILSSLPDRQKQLPQLILHSSEDTISHPKYLNWRKDEQLDGKFRIESVPRARHIGQTIWTAPFTTIYSLCKVLCLFWSEYPQAIITNGPAISVSIAFAAWIIYFFRLGTVQRSRIIYIESVARVKSLSLSGRFMLWLADDILVQWPEISEKYKSNSRVRYVGFMV